MGCGASAADTALSPDNPHKQTKVKNPEDVPRNGPLSASVRAQLVKLPHISTVVSLDGHKSQDGEREQQHSVRVTTSVEFGHDDAGNKTINKYALVDNLGEGAYGKVKLVVDQDTDQPYAIKIVNKSFLDKVRKAGSTALDDVRREIALMKKLDHPNLVQLYEVIDDPSAQKMFLVIEYIERGPVMKINDDGTADRAAFPLDTVRHYIQGICNGLAYLHHQSVVHRDIKPENLLVAKDDTIKVADFGVSTFSTAEGTVSVESQGTPAFMAPELFESSGASISGPATDVWSLGVTMFCLAFGKLPWFAASINGLRDLICNSQITFPTETTPQFESLLLRMLERDATKRISLPDILGHGFMAKASGIGGASSLLKAIKTWKQIHVSHAEMESAFQVGHNVRIPTVRDSVNVFMRVKHVSQVLLHATHSGSGSVPQLVDDFGAVLKTPKSARGIEHALSEASVGSDDNDDPFLPESQSVTHSSTAWAHYQQGSNNRMISKRTFPSEADMMKDIVGSEDVAQSINQARCGSLTDLNLNCHNLVKIPPQVFTLTKLTELHLEGNSIELLPAGISALPLQSLFLSENHISALPSEIGLIQTLTSLEIAHNQLTSMPLSLSSLANLTNLNINYNDLAEFPRCTFRLPNLSTLGLIENVRIREWPPTSDFAASAWTTKTCEISVNNCPPLVKEYALLQTELPSTVLITVHWNKIYPDLVMDWLFLGSVRTAQSLSILSELGIFHCLTVGNNLETSALAADPAFTHLVINVDDLEDQDITPYFERTNAFIESAKESNNKVLVHCFQGRSRSATAVIAYMMSKLHMTYDEAFAFVQSKRPSILPNAGFVTQLRKYEEVLRTRRVKTPEPDA